MPVAYCKETFWVQLVARHEISGSPKVSLGSLDPPSNINYNRPSGRFCYYYVMFDFSEPLEGLFNSSKLLVLDFSKINSRVPNNENLEKIFQEYRSKNLNPRKPENRQLINNKLLDETGFRYLIGQYGENRTAMLADTPAGREGRVMHMAIDVFAKDLEFVFSPCDGKIIISGYEPGFGEYGNYIVIQPDRADFYFFFGHLSFDRPNIGRVFRGQEIARLGDFPKNENGGWSRHLHIQMLTKLPGNGITPDGYSTKEAFGTNSIQYPNPLDFFPEWQLQ